MAESNQPSKPSLSDYFKPLPPNEKPPPPPRQLRLWSSQMSTGLVLGMIYGGYQGLVEARQPIGVLDAPAGAPSQFTNRRHRASAYFVRGSILHGARIGSFVALLSATSLAVDSYLRAEDAEEDSPTDPRALAAGAGTTCALYGGAVAGGLASLRAGAFGSIAGGTVGWVQQKLADAVAELEKKQLLSATGSVIESKDSNLETAQTKEQEPGSDAVGEVVRWLEAGQKERQKGAIDSLSPSTEEGRF